MEFPFFLLLIPYILGLAIFLIWTAFNVWHMQRFSMFNFSGKLNTAVFLFFSILIIVLTAYALKDVAWLNSAEMSLDLVDSFSSSKSSIDGISF